LIINILIIIAVMMPL